MAEERFNHAASAGNSSGHIEQNTCSPTDTCTKGSRKEPGPIRLPDADLVATACPVAAEMVSNIKSAADVIEAGRLMRGGIGAHQAAWAEACESLGAFRASCLVLIVAQLHDDATRRDSHYEPRRIFSAARAPMCRRALWARSRTYGDAQEENDMSKVSVKFEREMNHKVLASYAI
jgi:hypothetical protein